MFGALLTRYARVCPDAVCLVSGKRRYTWREFNEQVNRMANSLRGLGVRKGEKGALLMRNSPEFLIANFALQKLGAVPVPVNYRFVAKEVEYVTDNSDSVVLFTDPELAGLAEPARLPKVKHFVAHGGAEHPGFHSFQALLDRGSPREPGVPVAENDVALICYTGGTTGFPKGVVLTYRHFFTNLDQFFRVFLKIPPKLGVEKNPEYLRRMEAAFLALLDGLAKPLLADPDFSGKSFVFRFENVVLTNKIEDGRLKFYSGADPNAVMGITWRGNIPNLFNRVVPYLMSPSPLAPLKLLGLLLKGDFKITGKKSLGRKFLKASRKVLRGQSPQTKLLFATPMFHMAGYAGGPVVWAAGGNQTMVLTEGASFDPREFLDIIQREKPQILLMVPTMWKRVLETLETERYDVSSPVIGLSGAAVLAAPVKVKILERFPNLLVVDVFGQTEMTPATAVKVDGEKEKVVDRSVGQPLDGIEVRIIDDNGRDVAPGEVGEILYKSTTIMQEYYKDPQKTQEAIRDGWFYSGDLGRRDPQGNIIVVERKKECINSGGEKIYPFEVEEVLKQHPAVEEAVVIGVPHPEFGQSVRAVVKLRPGQKAAEQELTEFCKGKMAGYKRPRSILFAAEFPQSPVEKVLRGKIRELYGKP